MGPIVLFKVGIGLVILLVILIRKKATRRINVLDYEKDKWRPVKVLSPDIKRRIERDFQHTADQEEAERVLLEVCAKRLNVGSEQFVRAILVLAGGNLQALKGYANAEDPRDVVHMAGGKSEKGSEFLSYPFVD